MLVASLLTIVPAGGALGCATTGTPAVITDKPDYGAGETAVISGSGYDCGVTLTVKVTRPDGSVVVGDGSFAPGSDTVVTDGNGEFIYEYQLNGIVGIYVVEVIDSAGNVLATTTFRDSHFRYGHITWTPTGGNTAALTVQNAWRRSGYFTCADPSNALLSIACTGTDGRAAVGDVIIETVGGTRLDPGDGSGLIGSPRGPLAYLVTATDPVNDWLFGLALDPASLPGVDTTISHTYATAATYTANISSCCRTGTVDHVNNPNGSYRVESTVDVGSGNRSPVSALPPIVQCPINAICSFVVPGSDADGDTLNYRLSTSLEASGSSSFTQPGPPNAPNAATIDPSTGLYTWDTTGAALTFSHPPTFYSTQVTIEDGTSKVAVDFFIELVAVVGSPPAFTSPTCNTTVDASAGSPVAFNVSATDPDGDVVTLNVAGLPPGATMTPTLPAAAVGSVSSAFSWTPTGSDSGPNVMTFSATDSTGQQALCSYTVNVLANQPPVADPGGPYTGLEGSVVSFDASGSSDPDGDSLTFDWTFGDGSSVTDAGATPTHTYADNGVYDVCVTVSDGTTTETSCTIAEIGNVAPSVGAIAVSDDVVAVGDSVDATADFTDPGTLDTHTAVWDWGDGTTSAGIVTEVDGDGSVDGSHAYAGAGVYTVTLTVTDKDGDSGSATYEFVVVYDPDGGFVTGGGWIDSPTGAYHPAPTLTGRANFGFVSKYKKGATAPTGNTEFQFQTGDLNFHSSSYDWLVVTGNDTAKFKGTGTINGAGNYKFQIWAGDGAPDTFRIKIWTETAGTETVIYDNGSDQAIGGGSIVIHKAKK